ncbi:MAG: YtxH domain-containing protein [Campylobacteraceae bacterium]
MSEKIKNAEEVTIMSENPYIKVDASGNSTTTVTTTKTHLFGSQGVDFAVGAIAGLAIAYVLTNDKAQKALFKVVAKGTNVLQAGFEELKERFEDAKAEVEEKN